MRGGGTIAGHRPGAGPPRRARRHPCAASPVADLKLVPDACGNVPRASQAVLRVVRPGFRRLIRYGSAARYPARSLARRIARHVSRCRLTARPDLALFPLFSPFPRLPRSSRFLGVFLPSRSSRRRPNSSFIETPRGNRPHRAARTFSIFATNASSAPNSILQSSDSRGRGPPQSFRSGLIPLSDLTSVPDGTRVANVRPPRRRSEFG